MVKKILLYLCSTMLLINCAVLAQDVHPTQGIVTNALTDPPASATISTVQILTPTISTTLPSPSELSPQAASAKIKELFQTNGGCQLPCWWGITPGQTRWQGVKDFLLPFAKSIYDVNLSETNTAIAEVFLPAPFPNERGFRQEYLVENGIVKEIEILPQQYSAYSKPSGLLHEFGIPEVVYLSVVIDQLLSYAMVLYYPQQGIFALYAGMLQPIQARKELTLCFNELEYVDMFLWEPKSHSFDQTLGFVFQQYENTFQVIEDVSTLTENEVYTLFTDSDNLDCINTPSNLWPNYYSP